MKRLTHILFVGAVLTALVSLTAAYAQDNGAVSSDASREVLIFTAFYDGEGKFLGMDMRETDTDNFMSLLTTPPPRNIPKDAEIMKTIVTDSDFRPILAANDDSRPGDGGIVTGRDNETPIL